MKTKVLPYSENSMTIIDTIARPCRVLRVGFSDNVETRYIVESSSGIIVGLRFPTKPQSDWFCKLYFIDNEDFLKFTLGEL